MYLSRCLVFCFVASNALAAGDGYMLGFGAEGDSASGISGSLIGGLGVTEKTWVSVGMAKSSVELPRRQKLETLYGNIDIDYFLEPIGIRIGAAYWGDSDILDSNDWHAALYWRGDKAMLEADYEFRDFDFVVPQSLLFPGRTVGFDADGIGATARFNVSESVSLRFSGRVYDYSVEFRPAENLDIIDLFSVSRLSLINSLIDSRAGVELGIDHGLRRWEFDFSTWEGAVDRSRTRSMTIRYLLPMSAKTDIEFGIGYDDSDSYGDVTFFSIYLYFYGAD